METVSIVEHLGFPVAVCLIFGFAVWTAIKWAARVILEPLVKKHIDFLSAMQTSYGELATDVRSIAKKVGVDAK
jgi:hypothetical protein